LSPYSPAQSETIWSHLFPGKHQDEPKSSAPDVNVQQGSSVSLESSSMERENSLTSKSQQQLQKHPRHPPSPISERVSHWDVGDDDEDNDDDDTYNDVDLSREGATSTSLNDAVTLSFWGFLCRSGVARNQAGLKCRNWWFDTPLVSSVAVRVFTARIGRL
jgi:hypothetical protein